MMTLAERIATDGITMQVADLPTSRRPSNWPDGNGLHEYLCTLRMGRNVMSVPFFTGSAWTREPSAADVLSALLSDAAGVENALDVDDWSDEYGYDPEQRSTERMFRQVVAQTERLGLFLGTALYETYLWDTEE